MAHDQLIRWKAGRQKSFGDGLAQMADAKEPQWGAIQVLERLLEHGTILHRKCAAGAPLGPWPAAVCPFVHSVAGDAMAQVKRLSRLTIIMGTAAVLSIRSCAAGHSRDAAFT